MAYRSGTASAAAARAATAPDVSTHYRRLYAEELTTPRPPNVGGRPSFDGDR